MDRVSAGRGACLAGLVPATPKWRICASLQRRYLCKNEQKYSAGRSRSGTPVALRHDRWLRLSREIRLWTVLDIR